MNSYLQGSEGCISSVIHKVKAKFISISGLFTKRPLPWKLQRGLYCLLSIWPWISKVPGGLGLGLISPHHYISSTCTGLAKSMYVISVLNEWINEQMNDDKGLGDMRCNTESHTVFSRSQECMWLQKQGVGNEMNKIQSLPLRKSIHFFLMSSLYQVSC